MKVRLQEIFLVLITTIGCLNASTKVEYSQSINTCKLSNISLALAGTVLNCDIQISCPIYNENANFKLISDDEEKNISKIRGFRVRNNKVFFLPRLYQLASNLIFLSITSSKLRKITKENLQDLNQLVSLDLSGNRIQALDKELFMHNNKLRAIRFISNPILYVDPSAFDKITDITLLDFSRCVCFSKKLHFNSSVTLHQQLDNLILSCNKSDLNTSGEPEIPDYFDGPMEKNSLTSGSLSFIHQCTHSTTYYDSTQIAIFLLIQTSIIAVLFTILFVIISRIKSSKCELLYKGTTKKSNFWLNKSIHSLNNDGSTFNASYDELPVCNQKQKIQNHEMILDEGFRVENIYENEVGDEKDVAITEFEEPLYSDVPHKNEENDENILYSVPKKN